MLMHINVTRCELNGIELIYFQEQLWDPLSLPTCC